MASDAHTGQTEGRAPAAPPPPARKGLRLLLIVAGIGILLGALAYGGVKLGPTLFKKGEAKEADPGHPRIIPIDSITVNIGQGYLKITVGLETRSDELIKAFADKDTGKELMMQVKALLTEKLGGLQQVDIDTGAKINALKNEIRAAINEMLVPFNAGYVDKVIFVEFIYTH